MSGLGHPAANPSCGAPADGPAVFEPVIVCGMHRSGTSMVAAALAGLGVHLGDDSELIPPAADNPSGFFERFDVVDLHDEVLATFGGAWDCPPELPAGWEGAEALGGLRHRAREIAARFAGAGWWGFKDPRASLLLPFWFEAVGPARIVICVRNPLEVAVSLHRRNGISLPLALQLWHRYHSAALDAATGRPMVVSHYASYFPDPARELERLAMWLGPGPSEADLARSTGTVDKQLRHARFGLVELRESGVSAAVLGLYARLCGLAEWHEVPLGTVPPSGPTDGGHPLPPSVGRIDVSAVEFADLRDRYHVRGGHLAVLERRIVELESTLHTRDLDIERLSAEVHGLRSAVEASGPGGSSDAMAGMLEDLVIRVTAGTGTSVAAAEAAVDRVRQVRRLLADGVASGSAVVLCGSTPVGPVPDVLARRIDGGRTALDLDLWRVGGATHVLVTDPADEPSGWLDHLRRFEGTIERDGLLLVPLDAMRPSLERSLLDWIDETELRLGRPAVTLDLTGAFVGAPLFAERSLFGLPESSDTADLPYLDASIDLVVAPADPSGRAEVERVATSGVLEVTGRGIERLADGPGRVPSVAVVVGPDLASVGEVGVVLDSLPAWFPGPVVVSGEPPVDDPRVVGAGVVAAGAEGLATMLAGAGAEVVVVLQPGVVPRPGWLAPLVDTLTHATVDGLPAALALPRVVRPDGRLALDGSGADDPRHLHREPVTALVAAAVAVSRAALVRFADDLPRDDVATWMAGLAGRVLGAGLPVLVEPASIVHVGPDVPDAAITAVEIRPTTPVMVP